MGTFGFFIFLSVVALIHNWRTVRLAQLQRDVLTQALASGQALDVDKLAALLQPSSPPITWARFKIALLVGLAIPSLWLSWAFREEGMLPLAIAALFALGVAGATSHRERTRVRAIV